MVLNTCLNRSLRSLFCSTSLPRFQRRFFSFAKSLSRFFCPHHLEHLRRPRSLPRVIGIPGVRYKLTILRRKYSTGYQVESVFVFEEPGFVRMGSMSRTIHSPSP